MTATPSRRFRRNGLVALIVFAGGFTGWYLNWHNGTPVEHKAAQVTGTEPGRDGRTWLLLGTTDGQRFSFLIDANAAAKCQNGQAVTIDITTNGAGRQHASLPNDPCA